MFWYHLLAFVLGACTGSFLNVCIHRLPAGKSVVSPPSHCDECGRRLGILDLLPIASYLALRGRCRYCGSRISWHYPLVEFITGVMFLLVLLRWGFSWMTPAGWVLSSVLIAVGVIDLKYMWIPDSILLAGLAPGVLFLVLQSWDMLKMGMVAGAGSGLFLMLIVLASSGGMGGGDVKLGAFMGLFLGPWNSVVALFLAFLTGGLAGIYLLISGRKGRRDPVPFGPYLACGGLAAYMVGPQVLGWYLGLLA